MFKKVLKDGTGLFYVGLFFVACFFVMFGSIALILSNVN